MKSECKFGTGLLVILLINFVVAPPVDPKKQKEKEHDSGKPGEEDLGLEYGRYLQQIIQALEKDEDFAKKLENISADDIKSGKVAKELDFVKHNVRSQLDELKRIELERLRSLARKEMERNELGVYRGQEGHLALPPDDRQWRTLSRGFGDGFDRDQVKGPQHLDYRNPHTFEVEDLRKLIKTASQDLDEINEKRKEEFKQYELEKEHDYREKLKHMSEKERLEEESKHKASLQRHKDHPKVHHPGSKQQLEQVWEEHDQLPRDEFNPSTFFAMHDINGDGQLDEEEVEAILSLEIKKMYDPNNTDDDPVEMMEEYHRMREHIYNETDTNKDGLLSKQEFLDMTKRAEFNQDDGWKGLDEENVFSEDDLAAYERMQEEHMRQINQGQVPYHQGVPQYQYNPQHGIPNEQYHQQAALHAANYPQGGVPHPNQYPSQGLQPPHLQQGVPNQNSPQHPNQLQQHNNQFNPPHGGIPQQPHGGQYQQGVPPQQHGGQYHQGVPPQQQGGQFQQGVPPPLQGGQYQQGVLPQQHGGQNQQGVPAQQHGGQFQFQQGGPPQQGIVQPQQGMPPQLQHGAQFQQGVPQQQGNQFQPPPSSIPLQQVHQGLPNQNQQQPQHQAEQHPPQQPPHNAQGQQTNNNVPVQVASQQAPEQPKTAIS